MIKNLKIVIKKIIKAFNTLLHYHFQESEFNKCQKEEIVTPKDTKGNTVNNL